MVGMPSLYQLKPRFQALLRPLAGALARSGVTANQVTITTCVASVLLGITLAFGPRWWLLLPAFLFLRMALNAIDGMLAKEHGQQSKLGAILNELGDVISDAALALPFTTLPGWNPLWTGGAIFCAALTEVAGLAALAAGSPRRFDGPFGKSDRAFALGFCAAWLALGWPVAEPMKIALPVGWILLCCLTIGNRIHRALR